MMKKVLLHICCGVCAYSAIKALKDKGFYVEGFFYNPNIEPLDEYIKRKDTAAEVCQISKVSISEGSYSPQQWHDIIDGYKDDIEGGRRCDLCYEMRLRETLRVCQEKKIDFFTTTLTISPYKNSNKIHQIGKKLSDSRFLAVDFKKNDGFKETMRFAKKHNLYRQNYCGCLYNR
ncbi:MAG: epoxyqueuosine reductase QueH [Candidatus Omnitrophota bacterium]|nr:epoxyqueuosine reductase QueH [Candidatus Omnitrophota bacterium]